MSEKDDSSIICWKNLQCAIFFSDFGNSVAFYRASNGGQLCTFLCWSGFFCKCKSGTMLHYWSGLGVFPELGSFFKQLANSVWFSCYAMFQVGELIVRYLHLLTYLLLKNELKFTDWRNFRYGKWILMMEFGCWLVY